MGTFSTAVCIFTSFMQAFTALLSNSRRRAMNLQILANILHTEDLR